jgi:hypothetical protein
MRGVGSMGRDTFSQLELMSVRRTSLLQPKGESKLFFSARAAKRYTEQNPHATSREMIRRVFGDQSPRPSGPQRPQSPPRPPQQRSHATMLQPAPAPPRTKNPALGGVFQNHRSANCSVVEGTRRATTDYFFLLAMASLRALPGRNLGTLASAMLISLPVCGFLPVRA